MFHVKYNVLCLLLFLIIYLIQTYGFPVTFNYITRDTNSKFKNHSIYKNKDKSSENVILGSRVIQISQKRVAVARCPKNEVWAYGRCRKKW